jgi:lipopolysaccharide biosynthesis protein
LVRYDEQVPWSYVKKVTHRLVVLISQLSQLPQDLSHKIPIVRARRSSQNKSEVPTKVLVIVHAYWPHQFRVIIKRLNRIKMPLWIVVTIPQGENSIHIEELLLTISKHHNVNAMNVQNAGRDIGPFLKAFKIYANGNWDLIVKVHTKASQNIWFESLVRSLLQSDRRIQNHVKLLKSYPNGVITHPLFRYPGHKQPLNEPAIKRLGDILISVNQTFPKKWYFAAGSMFAISPAMMNGLQHESEVIGLIQFENESEYSQGSTAHVFERFLGLYAYTHGSGIFCSSIFDYCDLMALRVKLV